MNTLLFACFDAAAADAAERIAGFSKNTQLGRRVAGQGGAIGEVPARTIQHSRAPSRTCTDDEDEQLEQLRLLISLRPPRT